MSASVFQQLVDIYFSPETERRRSSGLLGDHFVLNAAQLICSADSAPNEVRLNAEVTAVALVRTKSGASAQSHGTQASA